MTLAPTLPPPALSLTACVIGEATEALEQVLQALRAAGREVLDAADCEELLQGDRRLPRAPMVMVDERPAEAMLAALSRLADAPSGPLVLVCGELAGWQLRAAITAGAAGIVLIDELGWALEPCLRAVEAGQTCVPRQAQAQLQPPVLSAREKQILALVVLGYTNAEIAQRLFLAPSTVKSHLSSAFGKLGVRSRHEAVEVIMHPQYGLSTGILALGVEPLRFAERPARTAAGAPATRGRA